MAENVNDSITSDREQDSDVGTITLNEVLELEDELIEQSAAVLGAANDKNCSFIEVSFTVSVNIVTAFITVSLFTIHRAI